MRNAIIGCLLAAALPGFAGAGASCDYPDEGGMPLRRAVTRVEMLPEVHAWSVEMIHAGVKPQYVVLLDQPERIAGRGGAFTCYWPVEVRGDGKLWKRFLVSPDGKKVLPKPG
jgi:hypothetical protein